MICHWARNYVGQISARSNYPPLRGGCAKRPDEAIPKYMLEIASGFRRSPVLAAARLSAGERLNPRNDGNFIYENTLLF